MTFLAVVSSLLPSSHVAYPLFFLTSATKIILGQVSSPWRVSPRAVPPNDATDTVYILNNYSIAKFIIDTAAKVVAITCCLLNHVIV